MAGENIFLNTDPTFNLALFVTRELNDARRMVLQSQSSAKIENIESNVNGDDNKFHFGARGNSIPKFAQTAGAVFRMCMLRATNIPDNLWPEQKRTRARNKGKIEYQQLVGNVFELANDLRHARRYWSKYDQFYPHYIIQDKIRAVELGMQVSLPSMMLIFKNNFQQVIEIKTTANATRHDQPDNHFDSYVHVLVTVYEIRPGEDGRCLQELKSIIDNDYEAVHYGMEALNLRDSDQSDSDQSDSDEDQEDGDWTLTKTACHCRGGDLSTVAFEPMPLIELYVYVYSPLFQETD